MKREMTGSAKTDQIIGPNVVKISVLKVMNINFGSAANYTGPLPFQLRCTFLLPVVGFEIFAVLHSLEFGPIPFHHLSPIRPPYPPRGF